MFLQGTGCNGQAQAVRSTSASTTQINRFVMWYETGDWGKWQTWEYLGTERSPFVLFTGLQRSVTTALRPKTQDEVSSKDLWKQSEQERTLERSSFFFLPFVGRISEIIEVPVVEVDVGDFLGGLRPQLWSRLDSVECILHCHSC